MPSVQFYTRQGCHLCEIMLEQLLPMLRGKAEIEIRDIDTNTDWQDKFDTRVPVLEYRGVLVSDYPLDRAAVDRFVAEIGILRR